MLRISQGIHPDDWTRGKGAKVAKIGSLMKTCCARAEQRAEHAEACESADDRESSARPARRLKPKIEKLKEQLNKAKAKAKPGARPRRLTC